MDDYERLEQKTDQAYQKLVETLAHGVAHLAATLDRRRLAAPKAVSYVLCMRVDDNII